jgi:hypothetical protein
MGFTQTSYPAHTFLQCSAVHLEHSQQPNVFSSYPISSTKSKQAGLFVKICGGDEKLSFAAHDLSVKV